jgi:hypothetical protein
LKKNDSSSLPEVAGNDGNVPEINPEERKKSGHPLFRKSSIEIPTFIRRNDDNPMIIHRKP